MSESSRKVLILGGAGFIGSQLAHAFLENGYSVTAIDALFDRTGASRENLPAESSRFKFIASDIEAFQDLEKEISESELVIDSMAWTFHRLAFQDPEFDLKLNYRSHLKLIQALQLRKEARVIYLGSIGQLGTPPAHITEIDETIPCEPTDIQGVHKAAAERMFQIYSKATPFHCVSLRIPNCYGPNQGVKGDDIGLAGGFIRDLLTKRSTTVFGEGRVRELIYVKDLCAIILRMADLGFTGFQAINIPGHRTSIKALTEAIAKELNNGSEIEFKPLPEEIQKFDRSQSINGTKLKNWIGAIPATPIEKALKETIQYFKEQVCPDKT